MRESGGTGERRIRLNVFLSCMRQALESEAETEARKQRVANALRNYKQAAGLEVDPQAEAAAKAVYARGEQLMRRVRGCAVPCHARGSCMLGVQWLHPCLPSHDFVRGAQLHRLVAPVGGVGRGKTLALQDLMGCDAILRAWGLQGQLSAALGPFDEAAALVSPRSRVGGEATLQKAICLDSMVKLLEI